jgi:GTP cyclohydrolase IA
MVKPLSHQDPIALAWARIIKELGFDPTDPHLRDSPARVARFLREWMMHGKEKPRITVFPNDGYDQMLVCGGITFHSLCAHHGLPFFGTATIGFIPRGKLVGLSKFARVVDHHARAFQVQEQLTKQIANSLSSALKPRGLAVVLKAEHLCMSMRGIQKPGHQTTTSAMLGAFRKAAVRAEFFKLAEDQRDD